uniref:Uncharacterized protein n=1 Tax=Oryza sativa subsp. japonica TaxID=39947 RepID=Q10L54_ORYSJ|nr:hypothetical protein LOC_Os03g24400 [Oryza sativa Japonica Group]
MATRTEDVSCAAAQTEDVAGADGSGDADGGREHYLLSEIQSSSSPPAGERIRMAEEIMFYGNYDTFSFDDVKSNSLSKEKFDTDSHSDIKAEGLIVRGRSSQKLYKLKRKKERSKTQNEKPAEDNFVANDSDGEVLISTASMENRTTWIIDSA